MAVLADIKGVGLGLKRELIPQIQRLFNDKDVPDSKIANINFVEIAPENWIGAGGKASADLAWFVERYPIACHGLCLSLGGPDSLNVDFLKQVKQFLSANKIPLYTEHLSFCSDIQNGKAGYLYDLLPIPFTEEAVKYVATRIRRAESGGCCTWRGWPCATPQGTPPRPKASFATSRRRSSPRRRCGSRSRRSNG